MPYLSSKEASNANSERNQRRRDEWFSLNGPCKSCGSWDGLELDHVDPSKKFTHRIWGYCEEKRAAELIKCQPLCGSCHKIKTATYRAQLIKHGTDLAYRKFKCRCRDCRLAHAEWFRSYRDRKRKNRFSARKSNPENNNPVDIPALIAQRHRATVS